ncbi:unnamed protein product [Soboliphyme baturini]|uniref:Transposase n=1 Tax=Soboliphyme baturini TaxID=241478 RepID=A0A183IRJ4_9BILA|nr:unnamed protein product [Soboliphyme baturini]
MVVRVFGRQVTCRWRSCHENTTTSAIMTVVAVVKRQTVDAGILPSGSNARPLDKRSRTNGTDQAIVFSRRGVNRPANDRRPGPAPASVVGAYGPRIARSRPHTFDDAGVEWPGVMGPGDNEKQRASARSSAPFYDRHLSVFNSALRVIAPSTTPIITGQLALRK